MLSNAAPKSGCRESAFHIGGLAIEHPTALAPMAALTDSIFRRLVKRQNGCGFVTSEMVSARALVDDCPRARALLEYRDEERPIGGQICGADPALMADAARRVEALGFDFVDVNMGCPARRVTGAGGGAAMMRDLRGTARVLAAIRHAVSIPLTIKLRAGWSDDELNAPAVARTGVDAGVALVSVHARTRGDRYRPGLREEILRRTVEAVPVPVIANGDIRTPEQAHEIRRRTGCAGVMSGRGAVAHPWLLREIAGDTRTTAGSARARRWILDHFQLLAEELSGTRLLGKLKTFSGWYTRGLIHGAELRRRIDRLTVPVQFVTAVEQYFAAGDRRPTLAHTLAAAHQEERP